MGAGKACVCLFVIIFNLQSIAGKPFFTEEFLFQPFFTEEFWCDLFCEDDDPPGATSTVSTTTDMWDDFFCSDCPSSTQRPINIVIPPNQPGMNVTMVRNNGAWTMNILPWSQPTNNVATTAAPPPTTAAPTTAAPTTAAATTAAGTTAAPGATTAAPASTTAAA